MKKNILFVHHSGSLGGAPKSLDLLIRGLKKEGCKPLLMVLKNGLGTDFLREETPDLFVSKLLFPFHGSYVSGYSLKILIKNLVGLITGFFLCPFQLVRFKPDIVHLNSSCLFLFAFWARLLFSNAKIVCHVREPILPGWKGWPLRYFNRKFVDHFISIEQVSYESIGCSDRNTLVYNPGAAACSAKEHRRSSEIFWLSSFARIVPGNGFLELIEYFSRFCEDTDYTSVNLNIYGLSGNKTSYEREVVEAASSRANIFVKPFERSLDKIFEQADLVVSPFVKPHFARMVIEGYAYGVPAFVNDMPGQRDVVADLGSGLVYSDYPTFKSGLLRLIDDHRFYGLAASRARELYAEKFTIDAHTRQITGIYDGLTAK